MTDNNLVKEITVVVRQADSDFEKIGGSSKHWVRDCFLPLLEEAGLTVCRIGKLGAYENRLKKAIQQYNDPCAGTYGDIPGTTPPAKIGT